MALGATPAVHADGSHRLEQIPGAMPGLGAVPHDDLPHPLLSLHFLELDEDRHGGKGVEHPPGILRHPGRAGAEQLDPASPYSMTSKEGGLVAKFRLASEALVAAKASPCHSVTNCGVQPVSGVALPLVCKAAR